MFDYHSGFARKRKVYAQFSSFAFAGGAFESAMPDRMEASSSAREPCEE
jgi:hypothetical protein